jgi:4-amino-4-deoxy-L-arabinose transferase-like glycosyltransferase
MRPTRRTIITALITLGIAVRLVIWYLLPETRFASDEDNYYRTGLLLATNGTQEIFLPPVTSWLIALLKTIFPALSLGYLRLFWVLMDFCAVFLIYRLAKRIALHVESDKSRQWFAATVAACYLLYVPAISYSEFLTSETPTVLLLLLILLLLTGEPSRLALRLAGAGFLTGLVVLTRTNLAGLIISFPVAIAVLSARRSLRDRAWEVLIFVLAAASVVGFWALRNHYYERELTLSTNSYYNLYIGNSAVYQEDLNLFQPQATPEQIAFREQFFAGTNPELELTHGEMKRRAFEYIVSNKLLFLRRALGRLARIFVPRTDQLQLLGGETTNGVFTPPSMLLMLFTNLQWAVVLLGGVAGLLSMTAAVRGFRLWFMAVIIGSLPLCLIAISKPRYSFVFDPLLIICACFFLFRWSRNWHYIRSRHKYVFVSLVLFFAWSWVAWAIFAFSSRIALR